MQNGNIVNFPGVTKLDIPPERVLDGAKEADLERVFVVGWDKAGDYYVESSFADGGDLLWLLETTKVKLLKAGGVE